MKLIFNKLKNAGSVKTALDPVTAPTSDNGTSEDKEWELKLLRYCPSNA